GPAEVSVTQDGTEIRLYGGDEVGSWLNRLIRNCSSVSAGKPASAEGPEDLREGAVRADGFLLAAPGLLSPARPSSGEIGEHIGPTGLDGLAGAAEAGAPPAGTSAEAPSEVGSPTDADSPTVVEQPAVGTDLTVAEQGAEGAPADAGAAPPGQSLLGRLTWDNGEVHELTAAVLIGREVANDPAVSAGQLVPLVPSGQNDSMSRVHAELRPRGGDVLVTDRASTNGTFVWDEGARAWHRLMPGEPYAVPGGGVLAFGERTATFEALTARVG
ncbi:MAG TPA: FHA domain-containing protein, partial [Acidimicrobiales bacterium]|nr:FHA domain-containing protein [Acidimicrobiales bacterium]